MEIFKNIWTNSKLFRVLIIISLVYFSMRLGLQVWLTFERVLVLPGASEEQIAPIDLQIYVDAATRLENHQPLYPLEPNQHEVYQYPPVFSFLFLPFIWLLRLSPNAFIIVNLLIRVLGYSYLILLWGKIFIELKLIKVFKIWVWMLPIMVFFSTFWSDLAYMNIYILTALMASLLVRAVITENLTWSIIWFTLLVQTKPHWAFAIIIPLLLGRYRFFIRLLLWGILSTLILIGIYLLSVGPEYGWQQFLDYIPFLSNLSSSLPWRGPDQNFLGYNHSIMQIYFFIFGMSENTILLIKITKFLILIPLGIVLAQQIIHPQKRMGKEVPQLSLDIVFSLYLGIFIWVDWVWEASLGCVLVPYLLGTDKENSLLKKILLWFVFLSYALIDLWQLLSYIIFGDKIINEGGYILTDYSIYFPIIMTFILLCYGIIVKRLLYPKVSTNTELTTI